MKLLLVLVILITTNAFASNEQLEAILKQYESTLTNHQVGMKSLALGEGTYLVFDDRGVTSTESYKDQELSVILKVDGTKIYEYFTSKDLFTGEQNVEVRLSEIQNESTDERINFENINLTNHILTANFSYQFDGQFTSGTLMKELLQSYFCGFEHTSNSVYTDTRTGQTYNLQSNLNNSCAGIMSVQDIKRIDLSNVAFCDMTLPDDVEDYCETKDMSFLTADI